MEAFAAASRATIGTSHSIVVARQVLDEAAVAEIESIVPNPIPSFVQTVKTRSARRRWVANTAGHGARDSITAALCRWDYGADAPANGSVASDTHDVSNGLSNPLGGGLDVAVPEMSVAERSVMRALEWPRSRETTGTGTPFIIAWLAWVCRKYCGVTRLKDGEGNRLVVPGDILAAVFRQGASREGDPQIYTQCVIFNIARSGRDGRYRSLHQKPAYFWKMAAGAAYRNTLAWNLRTLGAGQSAEA